MVQSGQFVLADAHLRGVQSGEGLLGLPDRAAATARNTGAEGQGLEGVRDAGDTHHECIPGFGAAVPFRQNSNQRKPQRDSVDKTFVLSTKELLRQVCNG
jgi:hypothetical protein